MGKKKIIQSTTITILLLPVFNNYGMESIKEENNQEINQGEINKKTHEIKKEPNFCCEISQEINQGEITQKTHEIKEEPNFCCEISQEINEENKANIQKDKEKIWEQIKEIGIKIEKKEKYLKILFPEKNTITKIKEEIFINFEMDKSEEEIEVDLDNIFISFQKKEFIKNGTNLPSIKKTIFINNKGQINYSFCIIPKKDTNNIKIYFTCKDLETKIYATSLEENKNGKDSNFIQNEEIKEENKTIEEENENQNISSINNNTIIKANRNKNIKNFTIEKGNFIKIIFLNESFNKANKDKIHFYCFPEKIFTPYLLPNPIKNGEIVSNIKKTIFNGSKNKDMSIKFASNNEKKDYSIYFTIDGIEGKFYADKIEK
jgi:hypothetical protein